MIDPPLLIAAGEAVIDLIPEGPLYRPVPGGAAFNSACAAARLGVPVGFLGALSQDAFGEDLARTAQQDGVDLRWTVRSTKPTPVSVVTISGGEIGFTIHHRDTASEAISRATLPRPSGMRALLLGGFSLIHEPAACAFEELGLTRPAGTALYIDLNIRPSLIADPASYRGRLARLLAGADIIKASDEDLAWFGENLRQTAPDALILHTRGAAGAVALSGTDRIEVPAPATDIVDTVGAGDVFNAAWLAFGLRQGALVPRSASGITDALTFAVTAASLSTTAHGAIGPTRKEMSCAP